MRTVTAVEVADEVSALLGTGTWQPECATCREIEAHMRELAGIKPERKAVGELHAYLQEVRHLEGRLTNYDTCNYDLELIRDCVLLGKAGVPSYMAWGPGHELGPHPQDWRRCDICSAWVADRTEARRLCLKAGVDAVRALGPNDTPTWPGHEEQKRQLSERTKF
jgi:hypothetical protein